MMAAATKMMAIIMVLIVAATQLQQKCSAAPTNNYPLETDFSASGPLYHGSGSGSGSEISDDEDFSGSGSGSGSGMSDDEDYYPTIPENGGNGRTLTVQEIWDLFYDIVNDDKMFFID